MCRSEHFYIKDPDDEYNYFKFSCAESEIKFEDEVEASEVPEVQDETETYCIQCAWHGNFDVLKK
jgi:hypothetical protein